ncbi:hypothetical protein CHARACLAT_029155 [Characodon lateralis]|uniref:Uncharacterized protein n=1 Tax=Characodon lateralis TaxID=208331 RepID=A0ABU7E7I6_9TELE|nr:hypothetical protein [Characodon lateralis]
MVSASVTSIYQMATSINITVDDESKEMWKMIIPATVGGLTVVFILVVATCLRAKKMTANDLHKRKETKSTGVDQSVWMKTIDNTEMLPADNDYGVYSVIMSAAAADCPAGSVKSPTEKPQADNSDVYHVYCTIPDLPPSPIKEDGVYSFIQMN